ncbi:PREDICTED: protein Flattop homolog [Drosophila arizonae]|uniref:Cilia- and flagella-associated protein 126 n=1 Tax=Drosophila arizonae TaxID=7263 RepID=A0ABM1PYP5_DROAR|nr:PREDICTED: protein Flattop homolog [Drosophila arizonae]
MAFNFSAMQYERGFQAKSVSNWEYPRFSPPLPRNLRGNSTPIAGNDGHLLPTAPRDGNFLGNYRGTYHLPLRITRSFATLYNNCLSNRYKYWKYPRDLCNCQRALKRQCGYRETLGLKDDPLWQRPACQTKCQGLKQILEINKQHMKCRRAKCVPKSNEKLIPRVGDASSRNRKKLKKRPVTAFEYNRNNHRAEDAKANKASKETVKDHSKEPGKDISKEASKDAKVAVSAPNQNKTTAKSTTKAPKSKKQSK